MAEIAIFKGFEPNELIFGDRDQAHKTALTLNVSAVLT